MKFSPIVEEALEKWITFPTWYTDHQFDMERFYDFAKALRHEFGYIAGREEQIRERLIKEAKERHPNLNAETAEKVIWDRVHLATSILEYLTHVEK
ncbi:MAG: hypothetical protein ACUZ8E_11795 [Candidatus Anammoxibacter sp.]